MSGAQPTATHEMGLNATQSQQVRNIVMEVAAAAHSEAVATAQASLAATRDQMLQAATEVTSRQEQQRLEHETVIQDIADRQGNMTAQISAKEERNQNSMADITKREGQIQEVVQQLKDHAQKNPYPLWPLL